MESARELEAALHHLRMSPWMPVKPPARLLTPEPGLDVCDGLARCAVKSEPIVGDRPDARLGRLVKSNPTDRQSASSMQWLIITMRWNDMFLGET